MQNRSTEHRTSWWWIQSRSCLRIDCFCLHLIQILQKQRVEGFDVRASSILDIHSRGAVLPENLYDSIGCFLSGISECEIVHVSLSGIEVGGDSIKA